MGNKIPELHHVNNIAALNRRARRGEFPVTLIEGYAFSLNQVRIRKLDQADIKPSTEATAVSSLGNILMVIVESSTLKLNLL